MTDEDRKEATIRRDERMRLAALLEGCAEQLGSYAADPQRAVELVAFLLRLDHRTP